MVKKLKDRLDNGLDKMIFESDAIKILDAAGLQELIEQNDNLAIATKEEVAELLKDNGVIHLNNHFSHTNLSVK